MDRIDYTFKFSTELAVLGLSSLVILINASGSTHLQFLTNNNLFSKELSYHQNQNKNLYAKSTQVSTIIASSSGIIPQANAEGVFTAQTAELSPAANLDNTSIIYNNAITKQDSSNTRSMILNQIKVYVTQPGDTLSSIAAKFNISSDTIKWANNLPNDTIKPGWDLQILPTNGVLHTVTTNDTLPDIANKFKANIGEIISYNNLTDENDINPGDLLIIPGGTVPAPPQPKPVSLPVAKVSAPHGRAIYEPAPGYISDLSGPAHSFPWGQCTYYVAQRRHVTWGGNAKNWLSNAAAQGARIGHMPSVGAIMVSYENRRYGHVGMVEKVTATSFEISEMNYKGLGIVDQRWIDISDPVVKGFIY